MQEGIGVGGFVKLQLRKLASRRGSGTMMELETDARAGRQREAEGVMHRPCRSPWWAVVVGYLLSIGSGS